MLPSADDVRETDVGDDARQRDDRHRARRFGVVGLVLAVGVAGGATLASAHDAARARRAAVAAARSAVDLRAIEVSARADNGGTLYVLVTVRNAGKEPVVVSGGQLGQVGLGTSAEEVPPGQTWGGTGALAGPCPPAADVRGPLVLRVRTADGVDRTVQLQPFRDFVLQADELPDPTVCQTAGFDSAYVEASVISSASVGPHTSRLVLTLSPHLSQPGQVAQLTTLGVAEEGIVTKAVAGLPATVVDDETVRVTVDISAPRCAAVRLPDADGVPFVWFRGRTLPEGKLANAYAAGPSSMLVAVLRLLARACPRVMTG